MCWGIIYVLCFLLQGAVAFAVLSVNCLRDLLVAYSVQCQRAFIRLCIVLTKDFLYAYFIAELMQFLSRCDLLHEVWFWVSTFLAFFNQHNTNKNFKCFYRKWSTCKARHLFLSINLKNVILFVNFIIKISRGLMLN